MSAEKKEKEEKTLREFFKIVSVDTLIANLKPYYKVTDICYELDDCYEFLNEYTDTCIRSKKIPDFFLRSRKEELPDLAIEVKNLERGYDRFGSYERPFEFKEYSLSIGDFYITICLNLPNYADLSPKSINSYWIHLERKFNRYKKEWEEILNRNIKEGIEKIREFLEGYFQPHKHYNPSYIVKVKMEEKNLFFNFTINFYKTWESENINLHVKEVKEKIKESKEKFENLRKIKSNKLDNNDHLELLLIKGKLCICNF
jgi:hypothetical protein